MADDLCEWQGGARIDSHRQNQMGSQGAERRQQQRHFGADLTLFRQSKNHRNHSNDRQRVLEHSHKITSSVRAVGRTYAPQPSIQDVGWVYSAAI